MGQGMEEGHSRGRTEGWVGGWWRDEIRIGRGTGPEMAEG